MNSCQGPCLPHCNNISTKTIFASKYIFINVDYNSVILYFVKFLYLEVYVNLLSF